MSGHSPRVSAAFATAALVSMLILSTPMAAFAAAGDRDPSFGGTGKVVTPLKGFGRPNAVAVQPDGRILVAGTVGDFVRESFILVRYLPSGSLDPSFGTDGVVRKGFRRTATLSGMVVQPDGKIVVVGTKGHRADSERAIVVRFLSDGSLDTGFGSGGKAIGTAGPNSTADAVAIDKNGRIVIVGSVHDSHDRFLAAIWRFTAAGATDRSFAEDGIATLPIDSLGSDVALDGTGRIVISGNTFVNFQSVFLAARFTDDGSLDGTFGSGKGYVTTAFGSEASGRSVSLQSDGAIVVGGLGHGGPRGFDGFALARYLENGALDGSFGDGGRVFTSFTRGGYVDDTLVQPDGAIVAVGYASPKSFGVARYLPNGRLDNSFSGNGRLEEHAGSNASGVALQDDGKLVVVGLPNGPGDFMVIRYLGA